MSLPPQRSAGDDDRPTGFPWPPVLLVATILAAWALDGAVPLAWPGVDDAAARAVGISIGAAGFLLLLWSGYTLHAKETTILPHHGADRLVTSGPFRWRRNPIYIADVLLLLGLAELTKNIWLVPLTLVFAALVTQLAILPEERHLKARFGAAWDEYAARTRRWI